MAIEDIGGEPIWFAPREDPVLGHMEGRALFDPPVYPEYETAQRNWQRAYDEWHAFVDGTNDRILARNPDMAPSLRHEALKDYHIDLKTRTGTWGAEAHPPFWNAQATMTGTLRLGEPDQAIMRELLEKYAEHAGPQTTKMIAAAKAMRELEIPLETARLRYLENANELLGYDPAAFATDKANIIAAQERYLAEITQNRNYLADFERQMPEIEAAIAARGTHTPPVPPTPPHEPGAINPGEATWNPALAEGRGGIEFLGEASSNELISRANTALADWQEAIANSDAITRVHEQIRADILAADPAANAEQILTNAREALRVGAPAGADTEIVTRLRAAYAEHIPGATAALLDAELSMTSWVRQLSEAQLGLLREMPVPDGIDPAHFRTTIDEMMGNYERVITFTDPANLTHVQDYLNNPALQEALAGRHLPPPIPPEPPIVREPPPVEHGHGGGSASIVETLETQAEHIHGQGVAGRLAQTVEVLETQSSKLRSSNKTLAIAGTVATLGLGFGALLLSQKNPAPKPAALAPEKPRTSEPIKAQSVQLGAEQKPEPEKKQWASSLRTESANPSASLEK